MVEQRPFKPLVPGSSPGQPTLFSVIFVYVDFIFIPKVPRRQVASLRRNNSACHIPIGEVYRAVLNFSSLNLCKITPVPLERPVALTE